MNLALNSYIPIVDFIADYLGCYAEVVLHDLTDLEHSIVRIRNGHISGRKEGDPCTDFVLRTLQQAPIDKQYAVNYHSTNQTGTPMKSGSFFIRNSKQKIIGMICINIDPSLYLQTKTFLDSFFGVSGNVITQNVKGTPHENLGMPIEELVDTKLSIALSDYGGNPKLLSPEGKEHLIEKLNDEGIFLLKGAVSKVAEALDLSDPSVYRYLRKLKKE